jgi:Methyltransferase domain
MEHAGCPAAIESIDDVTPSMANPKVDGATLVFPAVNQAAVNYLSAARDRGELTVCAASVACDEIAAEWGGLHRLPSIYEDDFPQRFLSLVTLHSIERLFCPVASVHIFMRRFIAAHRLDVELIGQSPVRQQVEQHRQLMARARRLLPLVELCANGAPALSLLEVAGVLRQASLIYGESNDDKLAGVMGIFANAPAGDVVEIGSLMGRSAFVLLYLAWRYRIGPLLTIDPWMPDTAIQRESPDWVQAFGDEWDFEALSEGFFVNMIPFGAHRHAHVRLDSEHAFKIYACGEAILSPMGGRIDYSGKIAVIHIDGNHDYDCVRKDCGLWLDKMLPESWLILDDYIWSHGDGPYRVGNELLHDQPDRVRCAFVCGKALFVKLRY